MNYARFYKLYGPRNNNDLLHPKIIKQEDIVFPKGSMLIWYDQTIRYVPTSNIGLLKTTDKPNMFIIDTLYNSIGEKPKRNNVMVNTLRADYQKEDRGLNVITTATSLLKPMSSLLICNTSLVNEFYRYKKTLTTENEQAINKLLTTLYVADTKSIGLGRQKYITIEVPDDIPKYEEMERLKEHSPNKLVQRVNDPRTYSLLEMYKWLDKNKLSVFSDIDEDNFKNIVLIFTYRHKAVILELGDFYSMKQTVKGIKTNIKGFKDNKAKKVLLSLFLSLKVYDAFDINDLDDPNKLDSTMKLTYGAEPDVDDLLSNLEETSLDTDEIPDINTEEPQQIEVVQKIKYSDVLKDTPTPSDISERSILDAITRGEVTEKKGLGQIAKLADQKEIMEALKYDLDENIVDEKLSHTPDNITVQDKSLQRDTVNAIRKTYISKSHDKNILRAIYGIQGSGHVVTDIRKTETKTSLENYIDYEIDISNLSKNSSTIRFRIPKLDEDGIFKMSGHERLMRGQRSDLPIKKTSPSTVLLSSYYGKLTIARDHYSRNNLSIIISKILSASGKTILDGNGYSDTEGLPYYYSNISKTIRVIEFDESYYLFSYELRHTILRKGDTLSEIEGNGRILIGKTKTSYILLDDRDNVYGLDNGTGSTYILIGHILDVLGIDKSKLTPQIATISIYNKVIPVIMVLLDTYTLEQLLNITGATYKKVTVDDKYKLLPNEYKITFNDIVIVLDKMDIKSTLLFAGLSDMKQLAGMNYRNVNSTHGLSNIAGVVGYDRPTVTEINNINKMFLDPMTKVILKKMEEPETFQPLVLRAIELLTTDYSPSSVDLEFMRINGDERISGFIYRELVNSIKAYEGKKNTYHAAIKLNPYTIWNNIGKDSTVVLVDDLNPIAYLKQMEDITYIGAGGRSKETMVRETREYDPSDVGVISGDVKDNTDVGVSMGLSADPRLDGTTGMKKKTKEPLTKANIFSPSTLLFTNNTKDDPKRSNFTSIQNGHVTPMINQSIIPYRSAYASVIAHRLPDKFCVTAKQDGVVTDITENHIKVTYKDGTTSKHSLVPWFSKETGGVTYRHIILTGLFVKGSKFKTGNVLCYDSAFFGLDTFNQSSVVYKLGVLLRTSFVEDPDTYEDSISLNREASNDKLSIKTTNIRSVILNETHDITNIKKVGESVETLDALLIMSRKLGDEQDMANELELSSDSLSVLDELNDNSPKAKYKGVIKKIEVYRNSLTDNMTRSLKKFVIDVDDKSKLTSGEDVDSFVGGGYSIKGIPLNNGELVIKFYIEEERGTRIGSKLIFSNQLKGTVSTVFDDMFDERNRPIEAEFSTKGEAARIVNSSDLNGVLNTILVEASENAGNM